MAQSDSTGYQMCLGPVGMWIPARVGLSDLEVDGKPIAAEGLVAGLLAFAIGHKRGLTDPTVLVS